MTGQGREYKDSKLKDRARHDKAEQSLEALCRTRHEREKYEKECLFVSHLSSTVLMVAPLSGWPMLLPLTTPSPWPAASLRDIHHGLTLELVTFCP